MSPNRRSFLKALSVLPLAATANSEALVSATSPVHGSFGHNLKLSLNVYSFNALLLAGIIDLFDVLDFCAEYNFDAIDPTGYYFPGYPGVPSDEFINRIKRKAFLLGLDISGTGVRNDFANPDSSRRKADIEMIKEWIQVAAKLGSPNIRIFAGKSSHEAYTRDQVFTWMAEALKIDPPKYKAGRFLSEIGWRLSWLKGILTGKKSSITKIRKNAGHSSNR